VRQSAAARADDILDAVLELLEGEGGYDAVQVRAVASRARVSLATMYKLFNTRDELVLAAVDRWMSEQSYDAVDAPAPDESPFEIMTRVIRQTLAPWEEHPWMLDALHRATAAVGGGRFRDGAEVALAPVIEAALGDADPAYVRDLEDVMWNLVHALLDRFSRGEIEVTEIAGTMERALLRMTSDNTACLAPKRHAGTAGRAS
jgi:AcrR family transcriptional regulator